MKRKNKLCAAFIIVFVALLIFPIISCAYSNQFPAYLGNYTGAAYIELQAQSFGRCALVFPVSYQENYLSFTGNRIVNVSSGTIYGFLVTQNGTTYDVRGQRLSNLQYSTTSGYQTVYYDIQYSEIYNTNIRFTNTDSNNEFVKLNSYQIITITILIFLVLAELFNGFMSFVNRGRYGRAL